MAFYPHCWKIKIHHFNRFKITVQHLLMFHLDSILSMTNLTILIIITADFKEMVYKLKVHQELENRTS